VTNRPRKTVRSGRTAASLATSAPITGSVNWSRSSVDRTAALPSTIFTPSSRRYRAQFVCKAASAIGFQAVFVFIFGRAESQFDAGLCHKRVK
jgi:hypothetical protein